MGTFVSAHAVPDVCRQPPRLQCLVAALTQRTGAETRWRQGEEVFPGAGRLEGGARDLCPCPLPPSARKPMLRGRVSVLSSF